VLIVGLIKGQAILTRNSLHDGIEPLCNHLFVFVDYAALRLHNKYNRDINTEKNQKTNIVLLANCDKMIEQGGTSKGTQN
jgi:hypothetical protein